MELINIVARTAVAFIILLILTRILGKKQISQLTFFNYVTGITFGSIAAAFAVDRGLSHNHRHNRVGLIASPGNVPGS